MLNITYENINFWTTSTVLQILLYWSAFSALNYWNVIVLDDMDVSTAYINFNPVFDIFVAVSEVSIPVLDRVYVRNRFSEL